MAVWKVKLKFIRGKAEYYLFKYNAKNKKMEFLYNFMPCPNIKDFISLLRKEDITFKWKR